MIKLRSEIFRRRQKRRMSLKTVRERRRHIAELFALLLLLISTHVGAMMWFEGLNAEDATWLTLSTITTVGYGDISAATTGGRAATTLLLFIFGIFLLAQIAGEWIDYRFDRRDRMQRGFWRWTMKDHILILNTPDNHGNRYLRLLVEQIRDTPMFSDTPIQVFSPHFPDGLPAEISSMGVVLHAGKPEGRSDLEETSVSEAKFIVLLAVDINDSRSDSVNLDMLDQLTGFDLKGHIIAECVLESNRDRLKRLGANAVIRPIRAYPELLVRAMAAPGTEAILEDLFVYAGNHPRRYDVEFEGKPWGALATLLLQKGLGTPLGYLDRELSLVTNPPPEANVSGHAIFLMVSQNSEVRHDVVLECLASA